MKDKRHSNKFERFLDAIFDGPTMLVFACIGSTIFLLFVAILTT